MAQSLPVFCVSSRAYQGLCERLGTGERIPDGFKEVNETQMPQLISHAKKFAGVAWLEAGKSFLNGLLQVLQSLHIWCDPRDNEFVFSNKDKQDAQNDVKDALTNLDNVWHNPFLCGV